MKMYSTNAILSIVNFIVLLSEVKKQMKKKISDVMDYDSGDEDDDGGFSDEEVDFEGDEDFADAFKEYDEDMIDEENIEFSEDGKDLL
jgi:hypothetical protein